MNEVQMEIRHEIRALIVRTFMEGADPSALRDDVSLAGAHIVDSLNAVELMIFIEERYGFSVEYEEAVPENFDTVNAIVAYVMRKRAL